MSVAVGKMAVKTGSWVLWERKYGELSISAPSKGAMKKRAPLMEYLSLQGRFKGISEPMVNELEQSIEKNLARLAKEEAGEC